jgi:hypothetical protein
VTGPVARYLTRLGLFDLSHTDRPSRVNGIPFVNLVVRRHKDGTSAQTVLGTFGGRVTVEWRVKDHIENDEVRLRAVDFAPMLVAWVESERKARSE